MTEERLMSIAPAATAASSTFTSTDPRSAATSPESVNATAAGEGRTADPRAAITADTQDRVEVPADDESTTVQATETASTAAAETAAAEQDQQVAELAETDSVRTTFEVEETTRTVEEEPVGGLIDTVV